VATVDESECVARSCKRQAFAHAAPNTNTHSTSMTEAMRRLSRGVLIGVMAMRCIGPMVGFCPDRDLIWVRPERKIQAHTIATANDRDSARRGTTARPYQASQEETPGRSQVSSHLLGWPGEARAGGTQ